MTFYQVAFLFFTYSFLGWVGEVVFTAAVRRKYQDRGVLSGPLCILYGISALVITFALRDIRDGWFFLFVFSAVYATVIEWIGGHILEYTSHTRWWDYSTQPFNLDGYICLGASVTWGVLGVIMLKWGNPLLLALYSLVPQGVWAVVLWAALILLGIDLIGTLLAMAGLRYRWPAAEAIENRLANLTVRGGDITETIFCRVVGGEWMSRSSVVWGPFSIVWGLAIALVTQLLYRYKDKPASWLFVTGTLLGGAYEYLCSVFTEVVFGAVFWDYSAIPFNLGGRINLLYCFFWGFAAVAWFKLLYPPISALIEKLPPRGGRVLTWALCVFMAADMVVSSAALVRYNDRLNGVPAANSIETYLDEHYDNDRMYKVYPKAVHTG